MLEDTAPAKIVKAEEELRIRLLVDRGAPLMVKVWALARVATVVVLIVGALNKEP